jgi:hypothetical protein
LLIINATHYPTSQFTLGLKDKDLTVLASVANSLKNFLASPEEKFGCRGKKFGSPVMFTF